MNITFRPKRTKPRVRTSSGCGMKSRTWKKIFRR